MSATILKTIVSFIVSIIAWFSAIHTGFNIFYVLISIGLTFAVPADSFLQFIRSNEKKI